MKIDKNFVSELKAIPPREMLKHLRADDRPHFNTFWSLGNEIKPADLYCYLYARFGPPNGIQNILREDTSDNLIHWEWELLSQGCIMLIQGQNFRTDIWLSGEEQPPEALKALVLALRETFHVYGPGMGKVRKSLEHWIEFVNPYQRIRRSIESLTKELESIGIENDLNYKRDLRDYESPKAWS